MTSPTARTLAFLRGCGHAADVVERWLPRVNRRRDLFGCIDVIAVRRGEAGVLAVQATSLANVSARLVKAKGRPELWTWLSAGNRFSVFGWYRRAGKWRVKIVALRSADLAAVVVQPVARRGRRAVQRDMFGGIAGADLGPEAGLTCADAAGAEQCNGKWR
jgi:hypothetical protein